MTPAKGDIVTTASGDKWRIREQWGSGLVLAEHVTTGVVAHLHANDLTILERYPQ